MTAELLRLRCRGHREIRATHTKTLEFAAAAEITGRATCVVGVGSTPVGPFEPIAGPVRITVRVGDLSATVRALANPLWRPGGAAVVRRSAERLPGTVATDADLSSADLPRDMAAALRDPAAVVDVLVTRDAGVDARLVRLRLGPETGDRLAAEVAAADLVLAEDGAARRAVTALTGREPPPGNGLDVLGDGGRVLTVSTLDGTSAVVRALLAERPAVEVLGVPPELAVAGVSPRGGPVLLATGVDRRGVVRLATAHRSATVVFRCAARDLGRRLDELARAAGATHAAVGAGERPVWGPLALVREFRGSGEVLCALDPVDDPAGEPDPDLSPAALLTALLARDVSARTLVQALAEQPGWSRTRAYDYVLGLRGARRD